MLLWLILHLTGKYFFEGIKAVSYFTMHKTFMPFVCH